MPVKWTPSNVQMLLWLAWGNCKFEAQDIIDIWPDIPGEEPPTKRAIQEKVGGIRKGVREYGVASFFGHGPPIPKKSKRPINRPGRQPTTRLPGVDDLDPTSTAAEAEGQRGTVRQDTTAVKQEVSNTSIKSEEPIAVAEKQYKRALSTPPKTPIRGRPSAAAKPLSRKRRRSDADTGSDSDSMTTETSKSEISTTAPDFNMKLRPDHRNVNVYESEGETYEAASDGSDGAWEPGREDGTGRRKRVRRH